MADPGGLTEGRSLLTLITIVGGMMPLGALFAYPSALFYRFVRDEPVKFSDWTLHGSMIGGWIALIFIFADRIVGTLIS